VDEEMISWLLEGDASIQFQVQRDLLDELRPDIQARIDRAGWGAAFLEKRHPDGYWGRGFYQPKWTSSHYTLLDLKTLQIPPENERVRRSIDLILDTRKSADGGINPAKTIEVSDVCVNGMFLSYACYFGTDEGRLKSIVDYIIDERMEDGGFNCERIRPGARHSSLHSTICVLEGIREYARQGYSYRLDDLEAAAGTSREFILLHQLYMSDHTGEIINKDFLMLRFPARWHYNILRALDYFQDAGVAWDERMRPACEVLLKKRRADGRWPLQANYTGALHFEMEKPGQPSRWNTLRVLRVLKHFNLI
jgi:hypothetical protein